MEGVEEEPGVGDKTEQVELAVGKEQGGVDV